MKKTYIIPEMLTVRTAQVLPLCGSLTEQGATFFDADATGAAMVKENSRPSYNVWDDDWSAE